jgi:DNA-binding transcriptional MerR regulator/methylmalonyl-CoA mutase cobalamin-binding subunit
LASSTDSGNIDFVTDLHPIRIAADRTGLTPHRIRAWEKRYGAIKPHRTETNRRLYSDEDLERLALLRRATLGDRSISEIAPLATAELRGMVEDDERAATERRIRPSEREQVSATIASSLKACMDAVNDLDPLRLHRALDAATVLFGRAAVMERIVVPIMHGVGAGWREGTLRQAHEHMATAVVRTYLGELSHAFQLSAAAPELVVATPLGQFHELGALLAASIAVSEGWRSTYLGPNLTAETIAEPALRRRASAVALSILYPLDDPGLPLELEKLARLLPPAIALIVGGRAAADYQDVLGRVGAIQLVDYDSLRQTLETLRGARDSTRLSRWSV